MSLGKRIQSFFTNRSIVLMYHRVATVEIDPWQLCVSEKNFEEHLQVLQDYRLTSVDALLKGLANKKVESKGITITFDDGYKDNYDVAKPLLQKYNCPATFFITSGAVDSTQRFWWDELEQIILYAKQLPPRLEIVISGELFTYDFETVEPGKDSLEKHKYWYWPDEPPTTRCDLYLKLWEQLKPLPHYQIDKVIAHLRSWAGETVSSEKRFTVTNDELQELSRSNLFSIGAHTVSHPDLISHRKEVQEGEICNSKKVLEDYCNTSMTTISYPYGNYDNDTLAIASDKFLAGFTTEEVVVTNKTANLEIGRFQVNNWTGEKFEEQINKWFKSYEG
jgi:peptidoglycan/xylan/chitin deacetylase (PgdA/CDA1 family)